MKENIEKKYCKSAKLVRLMLFSSGGLRRSKNVMEYRFAFGYVIPVYSFLIQ